MTIVTTECPNCLRRLESGIRLVTGKDGEGFSRQALGKECNACGTLYVPPERKVTPHEYFLQTTPH